MSESEPTPAVSLADFESAVAELDAIVQAMEAGDLTLEQALARFERGVTLVKSCQAAVRQAELRVAQLTQDGDGMHLDDLPADDD